MIQNETQYQITKDQLQTFSQTLIEFNVINFNSKGVSEILFNHGKFAIQYIVKMLGQEIADYEGKKRYISNKIDEALRQETGAPLEECQKIVEANPTGTIEQWKEDLRRFGKKF